MSMYAEESALLIGSWVWVRHADAPALAERVRAKCPALGPSLKTEDAEPGVITLWEENLLSAFQRRDTVEALVDRLARPFYALTPGLWKEFLNIAEKKHA